MSHAEKQRSANAVGGRTARACDGCLRRRARWFCAADDAFLCQACDTSVHSANHLTRRHDRVRLKSLSSWSSSALKSVDAAAAPAWHQGFTRKARTPRGPHHHHVKPEASSKGGPVVPDLDASGDEEEQLLYRVPIFDPALAEFCSPPVLDETKPARQMPDYTQPPTNGSDGLAEFDPSETELADFAADVESMLGQRLDDGQFCMKELGLLDDVKVELDADVACGSAGMGVDYDMEMSRETLDGNNEEIEEQKPETRELALRLDYEAVIDAWSVHGRSLWTDGERPQISLDDWWVDYMVVQDHHTRLSSLQMMGGSGDWGREAKVTRYREKRRTRLFSKKIRYEVRKLNAEKRPRMKGRFVKRASFQAAAGLDSPIDV